MNFENYIPTNFDHDKMNAFKFMKETSIPIKHQEVRTKILSLVNEIETANSLTNLFSLYLHRSSHYRHRYELSSPSIK